MRQRPQNPVTRMLREARRRAEGAEMDAAILSDLLAREKARVSAWVNAHVRVTQVLARHGLEYPRSTPP